MLRICMSLSLMCHVINALMPTHAQCVKTGYAEASILLELTGHEVW